MSALESVASDTALVSEGAGSSGPRQPDRLLSKSNRLVQLDLLRGIAILMVVGAHPVMANDAGRLQWLSSAWVRFGWTGVDLFFVLSGYLVGGLLFKELKATGRLDFKRFLVRRAFKIWPSYFLFLLCYALYCRLHFHASGQSLLELLSFNLMHLQNYFIPSETFHSAFLAQLGFKLRHTWSLAVEEHFYLALPLLLAALTRQGTSRLRRGFPFVVGAVLLLCLLGRAALRGTYLNLPMPIGQTHLRIDSLLLGVLIAYFSHLEPGLFQRRTRHPGIWAGAGLLLLTPALFLELGSPLIKTIGYTLLACGYGSLLIAAMRAPTASQTFQRFLNGQPARLLAFIGFYSYSIYLWHLMPGQFLPNWIMHHLSWTGFPELRWLFVMVSYFASAIGVGVLLGKLIEMPALALRDRLFPSV